MQHPRKKRTLFGYQWILDQGKIFYVPGKLNRIYTSSLTIEEIMISKNQIKIFKIVGNLLKQFKGEIQCLNTYGFSVVMPVSQMNIGICSLLLSKFYAPINILSAIIKKNLIIVLFPNMEISCYDCFSKDFFAHRQETQKISARNIENNIFPVNLFKKTF